jgi:cystathionine beta-lyase
VDRFIESLQLFGLGASWGGYESLVTAAHMTRARSVTDWSARGPVVRLHVGLEDPSELIEDLSAAFEAVRPDR